MKVIKALQMGQRMLEQHRLALPQLEAGMLLAHLLECERAYLYLDRERELSADKIEEYMALIKKRCQGVPIQYITRQREFMGLDFYVDERVLIPRPDTECLVEYIIEYATNLETSPIRILDVGTGSGAIAVSLASYLPKAVLTAVDIDAGALMVAEKNATFHNVKERIEFLQGNLLSPLNKREEWGDFDIMVSNPPYIPSGDIENLESQVRDFEPRHALDGGQDGLDFYRRLAEEALVFLKNGALWIVEVGYNQGDDVARILEMKECYRDIHFIRDLAGYNRGVAAIFELEGESNAGKTKFYRKKV